jgi:pilus assembly protein CpaC
VFAILVSGALTASPARADESTHLTLGLGAQKTISVAGIARIQILDPSVADVKLIGTNQILVIARREGRTTLLVWNSSGQRLSYSISIKKQDPNEVIAEIRKLLGEMEGISVRMVGDRIYLDGQAYTSADADRIDEIIKLYPSVKSFVKIAPNTKRLVAQNLNASFERAGLKNVEAMVVGSTVFLEGSVESQQELQKADLITKAIGEKVENLLVIGVKRMILSEVQFIEMRRSSRDRYGVKYPTDVTGTSTASVTVAKQLAPTGPADVNARGSVTGNSDFAVGFQANDGHARLLAQPRLVCASGEQAEFLAGGEVPIPMITANHVSVAYKQYGVILKLRPTADRKGHIQTELEAEVSEVDTSVAVSVGGAVSVPGFRTRKVKTNVTVRHGETIVLSGVFSHDEQKFVSKVPGLGNIPIIGELFKNRAFDVSKRELSIFVTPRIVTADSERIRNAVEDIKTRYQQGRKEVTFSIFD